MKTYKVSPVPNLSTLYYIHVCTIWPSRALDPFTYRDTEADGVSTDGVSPEA